MTKTCTMCGVEKPLEGFYVQERGKYGRMAKCIPCHKAYMSRPERLAKRRAWNKRRKNEPAYKERRRKRQLKQRYGLTVSDYDRMVKSQKSKCLICRKVDNNLNVDHDHKTGEVRGLLCNPCNRGLGSLGDNPVLLIRGAKYLLRRL